LAAGFFTATFFAGAFFATTFFAGAFFATAFFAGAFFATAFFAGAFFATAFFAGAFLAAAFFAGAFFTAAFLTGAFFATAFAVLFAAIVSISYLCRTLPAVTVVGRSFRATAAPQLLHPAYHTSCARRLRDAPPFENLCCYCVSVNHIFA